MITTTRQEIVTEASTIGKQGGPATVEGYE